MSDPNLFQEAGDFTADAAIDTAADGIINRGIDAVGAFIPGGEMVERMLETEVDQVVNNEINSEVNKGVGGIERDVEGMFGGER
jgi:hypothetical protein